MNSWPPLWPPEHVVIVTLIALTAAIIIGMGIYWLHHAWWPVTLMIMVPAATWGLIVMVWPLWNLWRQR